MKSFCSLLGSALCIAANNLEFYRNNVPFMELSGGKSSDLVKIRFELFYDEAPKTTLNFATILEGKMEKNNKLLAYKGSLFHRIIPNFMMQGGDFTNFNGTGGTPIYEGNTFEDEKFVKSHKKGVLSMANRGKDTNGSQFFITFAPTTFLDKKHLVFGKVLDEDLHLLDQFENVATDAFDKPKTDVKIVNCGFEKASKEKSPEIEGL